MKLLLILYRGDNAERVRDVLEREGAGGFTELDGARGSGRTGRAEGTRAWPGSATVFLAAVADGRAPAIERALHGSVVDADAGEHLHVATMPLDRFV